MCLINSEFNKRWIWNELWLDKPIHFDTNWRWIATSIRQNFNGRSQLDCQSLMFRRFPISITLFYRKRKINVKIISGLIGNFFFGFMTNIFGRKKCLIAMAFPNLVSLLIYIKNHLSKRKYLFLFPDKLVTYLFRSKCVLFIRGKLLIHTNNFFQ